MSEHDAKTRIPVGACLRRWVLSRSLLICLFSAPTLAQDGTPLRANPHAPPPPDPALLENPVTGPKPPAAAAKGVTTGETVRPAPTTRYDLAWAFMRFERALASAHPNDDGLSRSFDDATTAYFRGGPSRALRKLDEETLRLTGRESHAAARVVPFLRVRVQPAIWTYYTEPAPSIVVRGVANAPALDGPPVNLSVSIEPQHTDGALVAGARPRGVTVAIPDMKAAFTPTGCTMPLADMVKSLPPGWYSVNLVGDGGFVWPVGTWTSVSAPRSEVRNALERQLAGAEKVSGSDSALLGAFTQFKARLALVKDVPSEASTAEFLNDPGTLETELSLEVSALAVGTNPYKTRPGLLYGAFRSGNADAPLTVPMWTYAPAEVLGQRVRPALVIALHGAGADESMFMFGYGEGQIRKFAEELGFIVASPLAYGFTLNPAMFDDLMTEMKSRYDIDESRVYVIGHSMGGIAASGLAQSRSEKIAGVAAIAGLRTLTLGRACSPILAYGAELDRIIPAKRMRETAEAAAKGGLPVEYRESAAEGHTLVVNKVMRECLEWLMQRP